MRVIIFSGILFLLLLLPTVDAQDGIPYDEYATQYLDSDGGGTLIIHLMPENFLDSSGEWRKINNSLRLLSPSDSAYQYGYRYGATDGLLDVYAKTNIAASYPFAVNMSDYAVQYAPASVGYLDYGTKEYKVLQEVQPSIAKVQGNKITFVDAWYDMNITRTLDSWRWKEEIIMGTLAKTWMQNNPPSDFGLSNSDSYLVFRFNMRVSNLKMGKNGNNNELSSFEVDQGRMEFRDNLGDLKWFLPLEDAYELNNVSNKIPIRFRVTGTGNQRNLFFGVKVSELNALSFPVVLDPTDTSATINGDTFMDSSQATVNLASETYMIISNTPDPYILSGLINFTMPTISGTINHVDLILTRNSAVNSPFGTSTRLVLQESIITQATYNNRITGTAWANAGAGTPTSSNSTAVDLHVPYPAANGGKATIGLMGGNATNSMAMVSGGNYAFVIMQNASGSEGVSQNYASQEHGNTGWRPTITVQYIGVPSFGSYAQDPVAPSAVDDVDLNVTVDTVGGVLSLGRIQINNNTDVINHTIDVSGQPGGGIFNFTLNSGNLTGGQSVWYKWYMESNAGNNWSANQSFMVADSLSIISPTNTSYSVDEVVLNVSSTSAIDTWIYEFDGNGTNITFGTGGSGANNTLILSGGEGNKNVSVWGNKSSGGEWINAVAYLSLDNDPLTLVIIAPGNTSSTNTSLSFSFGFGGGWPPRDTAQYSLDGAANITNSSIDSSWVGIISGLTEGDHNITAVVNDTSGNNASAIVYFSVDFTYVILYSETNNSVINMTYESVFLLNGSSYETVEIKTYNYTNNSLGVSFSNMDNFVGEKVIVKAQNNTHSSYPYPREKSSTSYAAGEDFIIYLPSSAESVVYDTFSLRDFTLDYLGATIRFKRYLNQTLTTIHESYFDVADRSSAYLIQGASYSITLEKIDGSAERTFGWFVPTSTEEVQISVVDIPHWVEKNYLMQDINTTTYVNGSTIFFHYNNTGITYNVSWWVYNGTNTSDILFEAFCATEDCTFSYSPPDPNLTYMTKFWANNSVFGVFSSMGMAMPADSVDAMKLSFGTSVYLKPWHYQVFSVFLILILGGMFGGYDAKTGGLVVAGASVFFVWLGWLDLGEQAVFITGLIVLMAATNKLLEGRR